MKFAIGNIGIEDPVFLAPMTGVTDLPFRRLVKKYGAGLVFSEMIASRCMIEEYRRAPDATPNYGDESPIAVQLAGCEPDVMAEAARINEGRGAAIIDINFGCPVKKVVNKMAGSAIMRDEKLAGEIMTAMVKAVRVPVTLKMRLGWDDSSLNAPRLAKMAEDAGIQMITIHGRTRCQLYNGTANWAAVRAVKDAVKLPVIVNGDIISPGTARKAMDESGADGVMIGRGSFGRPWLVRQVMDDLRGLAPIQPPVNDIAQTIGEHYDAMLSHYGAHQGVVIMRKHLGWYCKDMPGADTLRAEVNKLSNGDDVKNRLGIYFRTIEQRPFDEIPSCSPAASGDDNNGIGCAG